MKSSMPLTCVFIVLLIKLLAVCEGCDSGWFGQSCNLRCKCLQSETCTIDGDCPVGDKCATQQFGPACQFRDVATYHGQPKSVLWDANDSTCNPDITSTSATIMLNHMFPLSWFRMVVMGNSYHMLDFTTTVNNDSECLNEQRFVVNRSTVDITCSGRLYFTSLKIEGTIVGSMCSLWISGGRIISLKERTWQSSNACAKLSECGPQKAVDNLIQTDNYNSKCSSTRIQSDRPEWRLYFSVPFFVTALQVYNTIAKSRHLLNFDARLYTAVENKTNHFNEHEEYDSLIFCKSVTEQVPISYISVQQAYQSVIIDRILTICEAYVYGDSICPDGTYGFQCWQCQCNESQVCNQYTGACSEACSKNCLHGFCDPLTGQCLNCEPGYFGENCQTDCADGYYGEKCDLECSRLCLEKRCDILSGDCLECIGKRIGARCEDCEGQFYGLQCDQICSRFCFNQTCNAVTGKCDACHKGYHGEYCSTVSEKPTFYIAALSFLPIVFLIFFFIPGCGYESEDEDDSILS